MTKTLSISEQAEKIEILIVYEVAYREALTRDGSGWRTWRSMCDELRAELGMEVRGDKNDWKGA